MAETGSPAWPTPTYCSMPSLAPALEGSFPSAGAKRPEPPGSQRQSCCRVYGTWAWKSEKIYSCGSKIDKGRGNEVFTEYQSIYIYIYHSISTKVEVEAHILVRHTRTQVLIIPGGEMIGPVFALWRWISPGKWKKQGATFEVYPLVI